MKKSEIRRLASLCFPQLQSDCAQAESQRTHRLWAGKGSIYRVDLPSQHKSFLVKHITPSKADSSQQSLGDRRKAASYVVEANFYEKLASNLREQHGVNIPKSYHVERNNHGEIIICMEYLQETKSNLSQEEYTKAILAWLATLHASHWNIPTATDDTTMNIIDRIGLQPIGSYWYLDTRPEEHATMSSKGWIGRLKLAARAIDQRLQQDPYQCIIHGDVKDANVIITTTQEDNNQQQLFMCDFQYCGKGPPSRDLAYFLCTIPDPHNEEQYLEYYLEELKKRLSMSSKEEEIPSLAELQESMDFAYCDFIRFMIGWAGHWGFNKELEDRVKRRVLDRLDGGKNLGSEEAYIAAMEREFGSF